MFDIQENRFYDYLDGDKVVEISSIGFKTNATTIGVHMPPPPEKPAEKIEKTEEKEDTKQNGHAIVSPMVGTFYSAPSSGGAPFVEIGSVVNNGDIVCVIEAMKLMNEIKSDYSGKVIKICVNNGEPVEYGQVLMYIE